MPKPLSRPEEIGRAVGYKIDADLLLERLKQATPNSPANSTDEVLLKGHSRAAELHASNAASKPLKRLWVVVKIERGVPVMIDAYRDKRSANKRAEFLRLHMRANLDQVELFAIALDKS
jgi:hypothetical protein